MASATTSAHTLSRLFSRKVKGTDAELLAAANTAFVLGGPQGLLHWVRCRALLGGLSGSGLELLQEVGDLALAKLLSTPKGTKQRWLCELQEREQRAADERAARTRELLNQREQERRMTHPQQEVKERLERTLQLNPAPARTVATPEPVKAKRRRASHCPKGIKDGLEALLAEIQGEVGVEIVDTPGNPNQLVVTEPAAAPPRLAWERSHGELETITFPAHQADPPLEGGAGTSAGDAAAAIGGDDSGFSIRTAWDVVANQGSLLSDLREFVEDTDENAALRSCAVLRAMDRLRDQLDTIPEDADLEHAVALPLKDAALIARQLLGRLR